LISNPPKSGWCRGRARGIGTPVDAVGSVMFIVSLLGHGPGWRACDPALVDAWELRLYGRERHGASISLTQQSAVHRDDLRPAQARGPTQCYAAREPTDPTEVREFRTPRRVSRRRSDG